MTRALITGATGFLGSHLCQSLLDSGSEVYAARRSDSSVCLPKVHACTLDLSDAEQTRKLIQAIKPDYVFHLAAITSASRDLSLVLPTLQTNLITTVNLLTAIAEVKCQRVVLAGSLEEPVGDEAVPSSPYAASKSAASSYARMCWHLYNTPVTTARIFMVYGPAQRDVKKLIPFTILSLLRGVAPKISSGSRLVDWIYVQDVVTGLLQLSKAPGLEGKTVDLGTGRLTSVSDVVEELVRIINPEIRPEFGSMPDRRSEQVRKAKVAESERLMGWKPSTDLQDGLRRTVEYYRERLSAYS